MLNTYIVKTYHPAGRHDRRHADENGFVWSTSEVPALSALAALSQSGAVPMSARSFARVLQNHPNEAVRDNAHYQRTSSGTIGAQAIRKDAAADFEAAMLEKQKTALRRQNAY